MAPKNVEKTTGTKRPRGKGASSSAAPAIPNRFPTPAHSARFKKMAQYKTWHEKTFDIHPSGEHADMLHIFTGRKWTKLLVPATEINTDLIREFYCNAVPDASPATFAETFSWTSYVRGKQIPFDRDAINDFLENALNLEPSEDPTMPTLCTYAKRNAQGNWKYQQIERDIMNKGRLFVKNDKGEIRHALTKEMTATARLIFQFLVHNALPRAHTSDAPKAVLPLIWCIMKEVPVDIARIIANEMKAVALKVATGAKKVALFYPGLIMGLLKAYGVPISGPYDEDIEGVITDTHIRTWEKTEQRAAQYHFSDDEGGPSEAAGSFDFSGLQTFMLEQQMHNQYVRDQNSFLMDQNEAIWRSNMGIHQDLYNAHMHPGNAEYPVMTPEQYQAYVHWPEGRPNPYVGVADAVDDEATPDDAGVVGDDDDVYQDLDMDDAGEDDQ
jgi:hypothetical protein